MVTPTAPPPQFDYHRQKHKQVHRETNKTKHTSTIDIERKGKETYMKTHETDETIHWVTDAEEENEGIQSLV